MTEKTAEQLYEERNKRIADTIAMKIPDRVPVLISMGYFPAKYTGTTMRDAWYEPEKWLESTKKTLEYLQPDGLWTVQGFTPGPALEYIEPKGIKWPGHGLPDNHDHQAVELENMKADEYDKYFSDRSDYVLRTLLPRATGVMEAFKDFPNIGTLGNNYMAALTLAEALARPEIAAAVEKLQKAGKVMADLRPRMSRFVAEIEKMGIPVNNTRGGQVPFDGLSDHLRGMQGAMIDMYRQPDKLLEFCERQLEETLQRIREMPPVTGTGRAFMALHRGSDGFMSLKQFEKFYWPTFKKILLALIDKGITPTPFLEGIWNQRLEFFKELPKGSMLCHFAQTDMALAKKVLGGHMCIMGDVPSSILQTATVEDVRNYCKKLMEICKPGGGFIMTNMPINTAKPENVKAMIDFTVEYGVYN